MKQSPRKSLSVLLPRQDCLLFIVVKVLSDQGMKEWVAGCCLLWGENTPTKCVWIGKHLLQGCAVTVENANPGAALWEVTQTLVIPQRADKAVRKRVTGKHLHCRADVTQLRVSTPASQISVLSCMSHPQEHPKPIQSVFPYQLQAWEFGTHTQELFPSFPEVKFWERVPLNAVFMQDEKLFWPQNYENSGGFHQTPPASIVRVMLIKGTADSALKKADNQIR